MSLGKGPPLDRCCIGSALSTGRRFKREPSRSIVKCDPGADFPWNSEAPSFERGRQPIPQSCPTERQWNNFSLSPASLPESCPTERLWDNLCAAASPVAPAEAGRSHPPQGSYRFRRDVRETMIAPQQIAPRDAPSIDRRPGTEESIAQSRSDLEVSRKPRQSRALRSAENFRPPYLWQMA